MRILNLIPLLLLMLVLTVFIGWFWLDWRLTVVLPYMICAVVLLLGSLTWRLATDKLIRKIAAGTLGLSVITSLLFLLGVLPMYQLWTIFVLCAFGSVQLYLADTGIKASFLKGKMQYIPFVPVAFSLISIVGTYAWDGNLAGAWLGLILSVILALLGLFTARKTSTEITEPAENQ